MLKKNFSKDTWKRNLPPNGPGEMKFVTSGRSPTPEPSNNDNKSNIFTKFPDINFSVNHNWIGTVGSLISVACLGFAIGVWVEKQNQPDRIADLSSDLIRSEERSVNLQADIKGLEGKLKMTKDSLKKAQETIVSNVESKDESSLPYKGITVEVEEPQSNVISEEDTSLFYGELSVSIVDIKDTEDRVQITTITVSAKNAEQTTYTELRVGDKKTYIYDDINYEILVAANTGYSVEIMVIKY